MGKGITSVEITSLGRTPARTHRSSGKVWLNVDFMGKIPPHYWDFIIAHEEGHIVHNTTCEHKADAHASAAYFMKYPHAPHGSIDALQNVLPMNNREQHERVKKQIDRVAAFECLNNGRCETSAYSNYTNCGKYVIPSKIKACQESNELELKRETELAKSTTSQQMFLALMKLQETQIQASALVDPELATIKAQSDLEQAKLRLPGFTIDRDKVLPIAVGIAVVAILAALLLTSSNSK